MSGYVRSIEIKTRFDNQDVRVVVKPLTRADLFGLQALLPRSKDDPNKMVVDPAQAEEAFDLYSAKLSGYVTESDVKDAAGTQVSVEEWSTNAYFLQLVTAVLLEHLAKAVPGNP